MGRSPCCDESGLKKGPWTPEEDHMLVKYIQKHGHGSWRALPRLAGLNRCGKSCRLRWTNYLRPDIKRGKFSQEEEESILKLHSILGNKWSAIAGHLPGRTDNEIKNFWNTHLKKKLIQMGIDPMTHRPRTDIFSSLPHLIALANLKGIIMDHPWEELHEALRSSLQADHQALQFAKLEYLNYLLQPNSNPTSQNLISTTNSNFSGIITNDMDQISNMINSTLQSQVQYDSVPFATLPGLQQIPDDHSPFGQINKEQIMANANQGQQDFQVLINQGDNNQQDDHKISNMFSNLSSWGSNDIPNSSGGGNHTTPSPPSDTAVVAASLMGINGSSGDACSSSSYVEMAATSVWPDLLFDENLFPDNIA